MKNRFLILFLLLSGSVFSQPAKGLIYLGPQVNYTSNKFTSESSGGSSEQTNNVLSALINAGYSFSPQFVFGINVGYSSSSYEYTTSVNTSNKQEINEAMYGLFGRIYTGVSEKVFFTNTFSFDLLSGKNKTTNNNGSSVTEHETDLSGLSFSYRPGACYFISHCVSIDASIGLISYVHLEEKEPTGEKDKTDIVNFGLPTTTFGLGVSFYLGKGAGK